jgi:hypothetical protein
MSVVIFTVFYFYKLLLLFFYDVCGRGLALVSLYSHLLELYISCLIQLNPTAVRLPAAAIPTKCTKEKLKETQNDDVDGLTLSSAAVVVVRCLACVHNLLEKSSFHIKVFDGSIKSS